MGKQILTFGDAGIEKHNFCHYKSPIILENVDIENLLVSISAGEKPWYPQGGTAHLRHYPTGQDSKTQSSDVHDIFYGAISAW